MASNQLQIKVISWRAVTLTDFSANKKVSIPCFTRELILLNTFQIFRPCFSRSVQMICKDISSYGQCHLHAYALIQPSRSGWLWLVSRLWWTPADFTWGPLALKLFRVYLLIFHCRISKKRFDFAVVSTIYMAIVILCKKNVLCGNNHDYQ